MKKLIAFLLAATMIFGLAACGNTPAETTPDITTTEVPNVQTTETTENQTTETTTEVTTETTTAETTTAEPEVPAVDPTKIFNEDKIVLSFAAISDSQHKYSGIDTLAKLKTALTQLKAYAEETADGLDAVFFVGDLVQSAKTQEVKEFKSAYESVIDVTETPLVFALGNHDVKCASYTVEALNMESFYNIFGDAYRTYDEATSDLSIGCTHTVINNYHFICINPIDKEYIGTDAGGVLYSAEAKAWLDQTLATITAENPDHYVFVNTHPMIYDTTYGSTLLVSDHRWYTKDLTSILEKYNQVVTFGGHVHFPLNDPRTIMQTAFTSLGCASVTYMAIENGGYEDMKSATVMNDCAEFSQGLLVQVDENGNMRITRMDFHNNDTIGEDWIVSYPVADGSHLTAYGKDRGSEENNEAPVLSEITAVLGKVNEKAGKQLVTIEFAKATDDEFAHHYELVVLDKTNNKTLKTYKILADFYRHADTADMKDVYSVVLGNLAIGTECEVQLTAYDSWGAKAETTYTFTVSGSIAEATPVAVYADFDFADGKVVDVMGNVSVASNASAQKATVTHNGTTATVDALVVQGKGNSVLCTMDKLDSASAVQTFAMKGFSVEAFYVMNQKGEIQGVVCGTQGGGWGVAEDKTGKPYFITGINGGKYNDGAYATSVSSTTELVHVVAVYDYETEKNYIYINGVLDATTAIKDKFAVAAGTGYNKFSLGNDITSEGIGGDYPTPAMTMVDAKIYSGALSADEVKTAYNNAVAALK